MKTERTAGTAWLVALAVAVLVVLPLAIWGASVALAPLFGAGNAHKQTETANYRIANYERFKDNCNQVVAVERKIDLAKEALASDRADGADSSQLQRDKDNLNALRNTRAEMAAEYNSDASKNKTRAKFKDAGLPASIDPNSDGGTTCS